MKRLASRASQRGFFLNPFRFGGGGGGGAGAHRYWRYKNILIPGGLLEISELRLYAGGSAIDGSATITSSSLASFGSPTSLIDSDLFTRCYWTDAVVENPAFWIKIDLGSAIAPDAIRIGGFDESNRYPSDIEVEYSDDDSSWTSQQVFSGLTYPGNHTLSGNLLL